MLLRIFKNLKFTVTVAQAIHGCIASPLQLGYQVSLVYRGINVLTNATESERLCIEDLEGNVICVDFVTPAVIFFSIIT